MRTVRFNNAPDERIAVSECTAGSIYAFRTCGHSYKLQHVEDHWWWLRADQSEGCYDASSISRTMALRSALQRELEVIQFTDEAEFGSWLGKGDKT